MSYFASITQNVLVNPENSSNVNLSGSASYTGSAASTLGVVGIQVSLKTDQDCMVYVDQSPDGTNWDIYDEYPYEYQELGGFGITIQAVNSYFRVRVLNTTTSPTTFFRLQSVLCPFVDTLPRSLTLNGNLKTAINEFIGILNVPLNISPRGEMNTQGTVKLAGAGFYGSGSIDPNFWITSSTAGTSIVQRSGFVQLTASSSAVSASIRSRRTGRYFAGNSNFYDSYIRLPAELPTSSISRWGAYTDTNGYFFEVSNSILHTVNRVNGVDTKISSGQFNGEYSARYALDTNMNNYKIYWTPQYVWYLSNDILIHTTWADGDVLSATLTLPASAEIKNTNGTVSSINIYECSINRMGPLAGNPTYGRITTAGTYILKYMSGHLIRITLNNPSGATLTIYDGIGVTTNIIASVATPSQANPISLEYGLPFNDGLTIVSTGTWDATIIYE